MPPVEVEGIATRGSDKVTPEEQSSGRIAGELSW